MPKYLDNSPLYSVVLEVRFNTSVPDDAVAGLLYGKLSADGQSIQSFPLPASQMPLMLRQQDPNLKYAPTQRLIFSGQTINIGSNVLSLEANNGEKKQTYPGWPVFSDQFGHIFTKMDFIEKIDRVGLRYINFFQEDDLFSELNVQLQTGWESRGLQNKTSIAFTVEKENLISKITIAGDATIQDVNGIRTGQVIDIDTYSETNIMPEDVPTMIDQAHNITKEIFYSLPDDSLTAKLSPHD